jgi:hypothetical protein
MRLGGDWVYWLVASGIGAVGVSVLVLFLIGSRSRGRRRCPRCWYSMEGIAPETEGGEQRWKCPECGRAARRERAMLRTRRRWRVALVAALVLIAAGVVGVWPRTQREGWMSLVPTRAVIELMPLGGFDGVFGREMEKRLGVRARPDGKAIRTITDAERVLLVRRGGKGNVLARPVGKRWRDSFGLVVKRYNGLFYRKDRPGGQLLDGLTREPASDALQGALRALSDGPWTIDVRTREVWPERVKPLVTFHVEHWWPIWFRDEVEVRWATRPGGAHGTQKGRAEFELNVPDHGEVELSLDIDVRQLDWGEREARVVGNTRRTVRYRTVQRLEEAIAPVESKAVDDALAAGMLAACDQWLEIGTDNLVVPAGFEDVAFGLRIEMRHQGKLVETARMRFGASDVRMWTYGGAPVTEPELGGEYIKAHAQEPGWSVTLKPDEVWALYVLDAKRYWKGQVTIPVAMGQTLRGLQLKARGSTPNFTPQRKK